MVENVSDHGHSRLCQGRVEAILYSTGDYRLNKHKGGHKGGLRAWLILGTNIAS